MENNLLPSCEEINEYILPLYFWLFLLASSITVSQEHLMSELYKFPLVSLSHSRGNKNSCECDADETFSSRSFCFAAWNSPTEYSACTESES